jgi:hypothetical protein
MAIKVSQLAIIFFCFILTSCITFKKSKYCYLKFDNNELYPEFGLSKKFTLKDTIKFKVNDTIGAIYIPYSFKGKGVLTLSINGKSEKKNIYISFVNGKKKLRYQGKHVNFETGQEEISFSEYYTPLVEDGEVVIYDEHNNIKEKRRYKNGVFLVQ